MNTIIKQHEPEFEKAIEHFKNELTSIRTGRANPAMVESIMVEAYGVKTPLVQLASIAVPEARSIVIQPWDKNVMKEIEKAIVGANIGLSPINEGSLIRITVPLLTEENRKELVKNLNQKAEQAKISVRSARDDIRSEVIEAERRGDITEDDRYQAQKELDELTQEYNSKIKKIGESKEKEIMTI